MTAQTTQERNRLATTRRIAVRALEETADSLVRFLDPEDDSFLCSAEIRADEALQMILGERLSEIRDALLLLRLERQCIRCRVVLPESEIRDGYCSKH